MAHAHHRTAQSNSHRRSGRVQLRVVRTCRHHVVRRRSGNRRRHEAAHEKPCDRRVAVGKVKVIVACVWMADAVVVLSGARFGIEGHAIEPRKSKGKRVLCRHGINAHAEEAMRARLVEPQHAGVELPQFGHEVGVAHSRKTRLLLGRAEARHGIESLGEEAPKIATHAVAHGRGRQERLVADVASEEPIGAVCFPVEEERRAETERLVETRVEHLRVARDVDAELRDERLGHRAVRRGAVDRLRAAVAEIGAAVVNELVSLGVAAEVVVVVEHQDPRGRPGFPEKVRRRETADAGADDNQVVLFAGGLWLGRRFPEGRIPQRVEGLKRSRVRSAQAGQRRRVRGR